MYSIIKDNKKESIEISVESNDLKCTAGPLGTQVHGTRYIECRASCHIYLPYSNKGLE